MDFIEQLQQLSTKVPKICDLLQTEEATKNALVMPFIGIMGYDIFNPLEVIPEFTCDFGVKKGEKVDYAIKKDDRIIILCECKTCGTRLDIKHASQLFRYFSVTDARIGVLTNGVEYQFFTDLEAPNKMDDTPFLIFNILDLQETMVAELKKITKPSFNLDELLTAAGELKYMREVKGELGKQLKAPSDDFVKLFASRLYSGTLTAQRREKFAAIVQRGFTQFINDQINERLKSAIGNDVSLPIAEPVSVETPPALTNAFITETTDVEREGYYIIKSILSPAIAPKRIVMRDNQTYCAVLLDDNNRKPLARLYFNRTQKYLGVFTEDRKEERIPIADTDEIYAHADKLRAVMGYYEQNRAAVEKSDAEPAT